MAGIHWSFNNKAFAILWFAVNVLTSNFLGSYYFSACFSCVLYNFSPITLCFHKATLPCVLSKILLLQEIYYDCRAERIHIVVGGENMFYTGNYKHLPIL